MAIDLMPGFGAFTPGGSSTVGTTWNSADKNAGITLSGGDLIMTNAGSDGYRLARSVAGKSSGKYYFEAVLTGGDSLNEGIGIANSSASLSAYAGSDSNSIAFYYGDVTSDVYLGGADVGNFFARTSGQRIGISVDLDGNSIGFTDDGSAYTDQSMAGIASGPYYIVGSPRKASMTIQIYTSSADWTWSARGGYSVWSA